MTRPVGWQESLRCPRCQGGLEWSPESVRCRECRQGYERSAGGELIALIAPEAFPSEHASFYNETDHRRLGRDATTMDSDAENWTRAYLDGLPADALVVELGAGRGAFSGAHPGLVETDISREALEEFCDGPRVQLDAMALPFAAGSVDALFSIFAVEHVPDPERTLLEIDRVLAPNATALLYPAWLVRPWAAKALDIRGYDELGALDRLRKATIPVRDSRPYRFARILPGRIRREATLARGRRVTGFDHRQLTPNHDAYLASDSDAFSSMDPHAMSAFFRSRGYIDLRRSGPVRQLLYAYEPVHVRKPA